MLFGSVLSSVLVSGGLAMLWLKRWRRRRFEQLSPGRVVIATNLVSTRHSHW